jgi:hypothetical protein
MKNLFDGFETAGGSGQEQDGLFLHFVFIKEGGAANE